MTTTTAATASPKKARREVPKGALLGIGNPLLDVCAEVPTSVLQKYGLTTNNAILAEEKHLPLFQELVQEHRVTYVAGGATQNSVRVAQWFMQTEGATAYVGSVGKDDTFAEELRKAAHADGVLTLYHEADGHVTGTCAVLVNDKDRSLVANLAAANHFDPKHIEKPHVREALEKAEVIYSAGFFLTSPTGPATSKAVAEFAAKNNKVYCVNLAAPFIPQFFTEPLMDVVAYADYVFGNESEARSLSDKMGWSQPDKDESFDIKQVALKVAALPKKSSPARPRIVVFTQGKDPTIVASEGKVTEFPVKLLPKDKIVDTNGAGDSFVGGFLAHLLMGDAIADCVEAGHAAARVVIQHTGCTFPRHEKPSKFLEA